jgi:hypothetical protein
MNPHRLIPVLLCCAAAFAQERPPASEPPPAGEAKTVTVTAEGYNRDDALKQALRKALELGAGTQIAGFSTVENYALARDTIYSRAAGIVREFKVLSEKEIAHGDWEVTIEATVRPDAVAQTWGEVQNVLDQIGRPKIMLWIDEEIDGQRQEHSIVETSLAEMYTKVGFDLVAREAVEDLRKREQDDAERSGDALKLARLAKEAGAHLLVRGAAHADKAGIEDLYGTPAAFYNCDVQAKVYYTDTGKVLAGESVPATRRGVRSRSEFSPQAARAALVAATFPRVETRREPALAIRLFEAVMEQWSTAITAGGDIELEIVGVDFATYVEIKKALAAVERVRSVDGDFTSRTAKFRIKALIGTQTFAELLTGRPFAGWFEVVDLKANRIQARSRERVSAVPESQPAASAPARIGE